MSFVTIETESVNQGFSVWVWVITLLSTCTALVRCLKSQIALIKPCNKTNITTIRSLWGYSKENFLLQLSHADWSNVYTCSSNIDQAWDNFKDTILQILNAVAPIKEIRLKNRTEPWFNHEIFENIRRTELNHGLIMRYLKISGLETNSFVMRLRQK